MATQAVRGIRAFNDGGQLRIPDARLDPGCTDRTGADTDLDNIRTRQNQFFCHFPGHNVSGNDRHFRKIRPNLADIFDEMLAVTVGDINTDEFDGGVFLTDSDQTVVIPVRRPRSNSQMIVITCGTSVVEIVPLLLGVMFVDAGEHAEFLESGKHLKRPDGVHIGGHDGNAGPFHF